MQRLPLAAALLAVALKAAFAGAVDVLPLEEVRPGMTGIGRTVFEGTRIDEFSVEILGVLKNTTPRGSMILARLTGGPLAETGVIAGMSGSPVMIDGKLVGAVAFGFPFSKETIAGITPIGEMLEATEIQTPRAASARFPLATAAGRLAWPLDRDAFVAALSRSLPSVVTAGGGLPSRLAGGALRPLPLPLVFSGFEQAAFGWAQGIFSALGFVPMMGAGADTGPMEPLPDLAPGGAVGVSLIEGDLDLSVTGTITHIDDDGRVYAFGHPFYNLGPTQFPLKKAYVYSVFPSLYQSWKIASARDAVGTMDQDRMTAIAGRLGPTPRMIPADVTLKTSRGQQRSYSFRLVEDELFSPVLAYVSLLSVLQANERAFGTSTIQVEATLKLASGDEVQLEDLFTQNQPAAQAAALVAAPMAYLLANDLEQVKVDRVEVEVSSRETVRAASLERAWLQRSGPLRAGSTVPLHLHLRTYRGETVSETIPVSIPASARPGNYTLLVADGVALTALEQQVMQQRFEPRSVEQLIRAINGLRRNNRIYARLLRTEEGAIVAGEHMQSLPPSVLSVLDASDRGDEVTRLRTTSVWEFDLPTDYAVSGMRRLPLVVER